METRLKHVFLSVTSALNSGTRANFIKLGKQIDLCSTENVYLANILVYSQKGMLGLVGPKQNLAQGDQLSKKLSSFLYSLKDLYF